MNKRTFLTALGAAVVALPVGMRLEKSDQSTATKLEKVPSRFAKIKKSGIITAGYIPYAPAFTVDVNNGAFGGVFYDAFEVMAKSAGVTINWTEELTFATVFEGFKTGRYDMVGSSVWLNGPRTMQGDFSDPLYYSGIGAYIRADDSRFSDIDALNTAAVKLATLDGEMTSVIAEEQFPKAQTASLFHDRPVSDLLLDVISGKADATFVEDAVAAKFLQQHPGSLRKLETVIALPNCFVVPHGEPDLKAFLNHHIHLLNVSGKLEQILRNNEQTSGMLLRIAHPYVESAAG